MTRYAILAGAVEPDKGMQKSLVEFKDFLTSAAGGSWHESEIMITGPLPWQFAQLLQTRLRRYDFVLVYRCRFSHSAADEADYSEKLLDEVEGGRGVFICDVCDEIIAAEELGYERAAASAAEASG